MDTAKDTTMQHVTDVTIVPEATTEFIAGLLARIEKLEAALRQHHANAMCKGCDHSHPLTQLRLSAYQQSKLYTDTVSALEESK